MTPIDMVLYCPRCHAQHIDASHVEGRHGVQHRIDCRDLDCVGDVNCVGLDPWMNPPHRSHLCANCGAIWRPADVPTNGVLALKTRGKDDWISPIVIEIPARAR